MLSPVAAAALTLVSSKKCIILSTRSIMRRRTFNTASEPPKRPAAEDRADCPADTEQNDNFQQITALQAELKAKNAELKEAQSALEGLRREQAAEPCSDADNRYRALFQNSLDGILLTDPAGEGVVLDANNEACRMLGWSETELIGTPRNVTFNMDDPRTLELVGERERAGRARGEASFRRKDGSLFPGEVCTSLFRDATGRQLAVISIRDITDRKQIEARLRESEEKYRTLVERANDGIVIVQDGVVKYANPRMAELDGSTLEEFIGSPITDHISDIDMGRVTGIYRRRIAGEKVPTSYEAVLKRRDGTPAQAEMNAGVVSYEGRPAVLAIVRDITERKRVEQELKNTRDELEQRVVERTAQLQNQARLAQDERDRLRTLIESMKDGVWMTDADANTVFANAVAKEQVAEVGLYPENVYGPEALALMMSQVEVFTLDGREMGIDRLKRLFKSETLREMEVGVRNRKTEATFYRRLSINPIVSTEGRIAGAVVLVHDITLEKQAEEEKRQLEEQLRQAQKLEAMGTLAGGIAHDFNNMLAVILGNAEMALDDIESLHEPTRNIEQIIAASKRARDLVRQILTFSRRTEQGMRPLRLVPLAKETMKLLRATLPTTIRIDFDIKTASDTVLGDPSQMQQVLMNLATNAAYAMRKNGGALTVRLSDVLFAEGEDKPYVHIAPGHYLKLTVQDTGPGITEAVREHIFEPFFTTKPAGHGTGMGLPVVYGIVKGHKGAVTVESAPGKGSTFNIFLPLVKGKARQEQKEGRRTPRGSEKILLVDDEPQVVSMTSSMLRRLGYQVTTAETGPEALNIFLADPRYFDLVITDETMPDITGTALTQKMLQLRADIPVILFTGHSETVSAERAKQAGVRAFLMKPVARAEMAEVIRRILKPPPS